MKREDYRAGIIASTLVNCYRKAEDEPCNPFDFFAMHQEEHETIEYRRARRNNAMQTLNVMTIKARNEAEKKKKDKGASK